MGPDYMDFYMHLVYVNESGLTSPITTFANV